MRKIVLFLSILFISGSVIQAQQDIFKKHGFNKETFTLSKGKYNETFANEEVVQIGTVLINANTGKIIEFLEEDTTMFAYKAETTSRFLTIDPHAERYYNWSPYVYCFNNPMKYIDPDGRDGMITGQGTKDDPYVITANYYYKNGSLDKDQLDGLNASVDAYNKSGGKDGVKIKNEDGSTSYIKYNMTAQGVDDTSEARLATAFETTSGETMYYGNIVGTTPNHGGAGDEYGSANNYEVNFNVGNINLGIEKGMNSSALNKGVSIHELGHNLGGEHSDGTSVMQQIQTTITSGQLGGSASTTHSYPSMNNNFTKIIFGRRDTPRTPSSGDGKLWTKKK